MMSPNYLPTFSFIDIRTDICICKYIYTSINIWLKLNEGKDFRESPTSSHHCAPMALRSVPWITAVASVSPGSLTEMQVLRPNLGPVSETPGTGAAACIFIHTRFSCTLKFENHDCVILTGITLYWPESHAFNERDPKTSARCLLLWASLLSINPAEKHKQRYSSPTPCPQAKHKTLKQPGTQI